MQYKEQIHNYVQSHKEEIVETLKELIKIPSVRGTASENAPFGAECALGPGLLVERCCLKGPDRKGIAVSQPCKSAFLARGVVDTPGHCPWAGSADLGGAESPARGLVREAGLIPQDPAPAHRPRAEAPPSTTAPTGRWGQRG